MLLPKGVEPEHVWPWLRGAKRILEATVPGALSGDHLICATDFSGTHSSSRYWVCSCLMADASLSSEWPRMRTTLRRDFLPDGRRMAYKSLNDRLRQKALPRFLQAADTLSGILCTIAVDKRFEWMATTPSTVATLREQGSLTGRWSSYAFEIMARSVLLWSAMLGTVGRACQDVSWIIDEDDIAANDGRLTDLLNYAGALSGLYPKGGRMGVLAVNTTSVDSGDRGFEDFVAIPDLSAGSIAEVVNSWRTAESETSQSRYSWDRDREKADYLANWYFGRTGRLRKVAMTIVPTSRGMMIQRILPEGDTELVVSGK